MAKQRVKTQLNTRFTGPYAGKMYGWYDGKNSYIGFEDSKGFCIGTLHGTKLLRLARTIVKELSNEN